MQIRFFCKISIKKVRTNNSAVNGIEYQLSMPIHQRLRAIHVFSISCGVYHVILQCLMFQNQVIQIPLLPLMLPSITYFSLRSNQYILFMTTIKKNLNFVSNLVIAKFHGIKSMCCRRIKVNTICCVFRWLIIKLQNNISVIECDRKTCTYVTRQNSMMGSTLHSFVLIFPLNKCTYN